MTTQARDAANWPFPAFRFGPTHVKAYSDTSAAIDDPISDRCTLVLVWAETDCHIAVGLNPTATTGHKPVTARVDTPVVVRPGEKIAAIRMEDSGTLYVTELL